MQYTLLNIKSRNTDMIPIINPDRQIEGQRRRQNSEGQEGVPVKLKKLKQYVDSSGPISMIEKYKLRIEKCRVHGVGEHNQLQQLLGTYRSIMECSV